MIKHIIEAVRQYNYLSTSNIELSVWPPNTEQFNNIKFICWWSCMHYVISQWYLLMLPLLWKIWQSCKKQFLQANTSYIFNLVITSCHKVALHKLPTCLTTLNSFDHKQLCFRGLTLWILTPLLEKIHNFITGEHRTKTLYFGSRWKKENV